MAPTICSVALMASRNANIKMGIKVLNPFVDVPVDSELLGSALSQSFLEAKAAKPPHFLHRLSALAAYCVQMLERGLSGKGAYYLRIVIASGMAAIGLLALVACATTTPPPSRQVDPAFARTVVTYAPPVSPGTIIVDPGSHFLYLVQGDGQATRYGVGVGGEGFGWSGSATIHSKQEWPDWYPPVEMLERKPELAGQQGYALPDPRHQRAVDHRSERIIRLHPHDQRRRHRPLQSHPNRREGRGSQDCRSDCLAAAVAC
jgi:hypothetical protein